MAQKPTQQKTNIKDLPKKSKDKPMKDEDLVKVVGGMKKPSLGGHETTYGDTVD